MSLGKQDQTFLDKHTAIVGESGGERSRRNFKGARDVALLHFLFQPNLAMMYWSQKNTPSTKMRKGGLAFEWVNFVLYSRNWPPEQIQQKTDILLPIKTIRICSALTPFFSFADFKTLFSRLTKGWLNWRNLTSTAQTQEWWFIS